MRKHLALGLTALLCTATVPAFAAWDHLGTVTFSMRDNHDSTYADFRGNRIALTSHDGDVNCRDIEAKFGNGRTRTIFRGMIRDGERVNVDLPGDVRNVQQLDFDCRPMGSWRARVDVAANTPDRGFFGQRFGFGYGRPFDDMDH
jgi:hypothetical protein